MAGRDWTQEPFQLTIPPGAGPNDPRIEIGRDMPADLIAQYATVTEVVIGGVIFFKGTTASYFYLILTVSFGSSARICLGGRTEGTNAITEMFNMQVFAGGGFYVTWGRFATDLNHVFGNDVYNVNWQFRGIAGGGTFNPQILMRDATRITWSETALAVFTAGTLALFSGGGIQMLTGSSQELFNNAFIRLNNDGTVKFLIIGGGGNQFLVNSGATVQLDQGSAYTIDGRSAPRSMLWEATAAAATGAVAIETVFITAPSAIYRAGRAYKIEWVATANQTVVGVTNYKFRRTNLAGVNKANWTKQHPTVNATSDGDWVIVVNATGADITDTAVLTVAPGAGNVNVAGGAGLTVAAAQCWDCGAAADFTIRTQF